jgi:hypothetical protein
MVFDIIFGLSAVAISFGILCFVVTGLMERSLPVIEIEEHDD